VDAIAHRHPSQKTSHNQWLSGDSRDRIAADNGVGTGTVSNIIDEWKRGVQDTDYESVREQLVNALT
jgi:hypothetical protein